jgi:hypothetical protein
MRIACFCKKEIRGMFFDVNTATEATGIGHVMANKGGVAIAFSYKDTSMAFVNCHLAAHQHKVARRNSDVVEIVTGISKTLGPLRVGPPHTLAPRQTLLIVLLPNHSGLFIRCYGFGWFLLVGFGLLLFLSQRLVPSSSLFCCLDCRKKA